MRIINFDDEFREYEISFGKLARSGFSDIALMVFDEDKTRIKKDKNPNLISTLQESFTIKSIRSTSDQ